MELKSVRSNSLSFWNPARRSLSSHGKLSFGITVTRTESGVNYDSRKHRKLLAL